MSHIQVDVIAPIMTNFFHCMHCEQIFNHADIGQQMHQDELEQYPEDFIEETAKLASLLDELIQRYEDQIHIRVIDPQSPEGLLKSIRYWIRKYPSFIINRQLKITGLDLPQLESAFQMCISDGEKG
jgi:hypothetical protein